MGLVLVAAQSFFSRDYAEGMGIEADQGRNSMVRPKDAQDTPDDEPKEGGLVTAEERERALIEAAKQWDDKTVSEENVRLLALKYAIANADKFREP